MRPGCRHPRREERRGPRTGAADRGLDVDGALVFACLLHLTGQRQSALSWWQLAAGTGSRAAAYCLHLHHLSLGEPRRVRHSYHQLTNSMAETTPSDVAFMDGLENFARYVRANGTHALPPTARLKSEVDRLAARTTPAPPTSSPGSTTNSSLGSRSSPQAADPQPHGGKRSLAQAGGLRGHRPDEP